jgi:hypothetical protein
VITLTNVGTAYDAIPASRGLGIGRLDFTGVTVLRFDVFVNKIGSGTQSWQLWNITDGVEMGVINDAGATGDMKLLSASITVSLTGEKVFRVRVKSTNGADDPIYYGSTILPRV